MGRFFKHSYRPLLGLSHTVVLRSRRSLASCLGMWRVFRNFCERFSILGSSRTSGKRGNSAIRTNSASSFRALAAFAAGRIAAPRPRGRPEGSGGGLAGAAGLHGDPRPSSWPARAASRRGGCGTALAWKQGGSESRTRVRADKKVASLARGSTRALRKPFLKAQNTFRK